MCRHTLGARASKAVAFGGCERHRRRAAPAGGRVGARREAGGTGSEGLISAEEHVAARRAVLGIVAAKG